jgi:hypothetical protein
VVQNPSRGWQKWGLVAITATLGLVLLGGYAVHRMGQRAARSPQTTATTTAPKPSPPRALSAAAPVLADPHHSEQVFAVQSFGRYAVKASSAQGAALQLVDRMAGLGPEDGIPGQRDGRVDVFLGPGNHKAILTAVPGTPVKPELTVSPFHELNEGTPPQLSELALVEADLGDLQQRSYWLDIRVRQTVFIEAAGRHLGDLRLWKDGNWLIDAQPSAARSEPRDGQPLAVRQLVADLEPGLYLLTAYGAPGETWTQQSTDKPFALRWGIPSLAETGRRQFVAGPFGFDRWLVPGSATYYRLEVPQGERASMDVGAYRDGVLSGAERGAIDKTSRPAAAEVVKSPWSGKNLVTVKRGAGEPYLLQHYAARRDYSFDASAGGDHLIGTLRPGSGEDAPDTTAVLTEWADGHEKIIASQTVKLGKTQPWRRRFNLLEPVSLFVDITEAGRYQAETGGAEAELRWAPFLPQKDARALPSKLGGGVWDLDAGIYVLTIAPRPEGKGILSLSLHAEGAPEAAEAAAPSLGASFFPVKLKAKNRYRLATNQTPGPGNGALLRKLPADLAQDLPLILAPGERRAVPVTTPAPGVIDALTEDNQPLALSLDGGAAVEKPAVTAGPRRAELVNVSVTPVTVWLRFIADAKPAPVTLPLLSAERLRAVPDFPVLAVGNPRFLDLGRRQSATFAVKVEAPALYRVETTGLLETAATMRTQVQPSLARDEAGGVGRNALVQQYLREGLYQLTVSTLGETQGHLGVTLTAAALRDGGGLSLGIPARAALDGGEGVAYEFDVTEAGSYRLRALSLAGPTVLRLEDAEGWPLTHPDQTGDLTRDLWPGRYRLVVQPQPLPGRMLTLVEQIKPAPELAGHGPHPLPLDGTAAALRWEEPAEGAERLPDVWTFTLAGDADVTLTLGDLMQGTLKRDADAVADVTFRQPWHGVLKAGRYRLETTAIRSNNRLDYTVTAEVRQLIAGLDRAVTAPTQLPVSLGGNQLIELSSFGGGEVRASLIDASGAVVARSGARSDDWNFNISARLPPGPYVLKLDPVGSEKAETTVRLRQLAEVADAPLAAAGERDLTDGLLHSIPLDLKAEDGPLLVAAARSADAVGLSLERQAGDGSWVTVGAAAGRAAHLAVPRDAATNAAYRLQVWSMDHSRAPITLAVRTAAPALVSEQALAAGVTLTAIPGIEPPLAVAAAKLDKPGLFRLDPLSPSLSWSAASDGRALQHGSEVVVAGGTALWFLDDATAGPVKAKRVVPDAREPLALTLPEGETAALPLADDGRGPRLWVVESRVGQPGITVGPQGGAIDARVSAALVGAAAAVLPDAGDASGAVVRLWRADGGAEMPLTLRQMSFVKAARDSLGWGMTDRAIDAGAAQQLELPKGLKRLRLALPPQTAAALLTDGRVERTLWSGAQAIAETLDTAADHLLLLNAAAETAHASILASSTTYGPGALTLARGVMLRPTLPTSGTLRVEIRLAEAERGKGLVLHLSGAVEDALLLQRAGRTRQGKTMTVDDDGVLLLRHGSGLVTAWLDNGDERAWLEAARAAPAQAVPATLPLSGAEAVWHFDTETPALLHLSTASPAVSGALRPGAAPDLTVWPQGVNLHLFLAPGAPSLLGLRPLQDGALTGTARLSRSDMVPIIEGLGPKLRLAPGDARLFGFNVTEAGPIGVGVRGEADSARVRLLDATGKMLAEGAVAMADLAAGRYFLLVENRSDAAATELQPALVGASKPDRSPPEEIKRQYWELVAEEEAK